MYIYSLKIALYKLNTMNQPGIICFVGDVANVSLRTCIFDRNASKVVFKIFGGVQTIVPKLITCKL